MPPYSWIGLESVFWVLFGGLVISIAIILARGSLAFSFAFRKRSNKELEAETHDFAGAVKEQNRPIPVFIWLVTLGLFVWAVAYVLYSGAFGF